MSYEIDIEPVEPIHVWMDNAACKNYDPELWFSDNPYSAATTQAKHVCNLCTVRPECLTYALQERLDYGMFAGLLAVERKKYQPNKARHNQRKGTTP